MARIRVVLPTVLASMVLVGVAGFTMLAQDRAGTRPAAPPTARATASIQSALLQPFHFTFGKPTPLDEVARHLARELNAPVIVDRAAIDRLGLKVDDPVQLELQGVRLKTGLKLLLDQLDLTYKVVPEDNLLVITDVTGSDEPAERVLAEVKSLHRDLHDLQDAVEDVRASLGLDNEGGAKMRKPTIIEEVPADEAKPAQPKNAPPPGTTPGRSRPGT